ncbi:MAG: N-acetyltransferase, partial [Chitinophagaceae bacterium]
DSDFIQELVNTPGWLRFIGDRNVQTEADAVRYIQKMIEGPDATIHVIRLREGNIPIGITTLIRRAYLEAPDIGFALLPDYEGIGYSREASAAVIDALSSSGALQEVLAMTLPDNERSIRLLERLDLTLDRRETIDDEELLIFKIDLKKKNADLL